MLAQERLRTRRTRRSHDRLSSDRATTAPDAHASPTAQGWFERSPEQTAFVGVGPKAVRQSTATGCG